MNLHQETRSKTLEKIRVFEIPKKTGTHSQNFFNGPVAVCIVGQEILLADSYNRMIVIDQRGTFLRTFGDPSKFRNGVECISQVAANKTAQFIVVTTKQPRSIKHRLYNYSDGKFITLFGKTKIMISNPGITIDKEDRILFLETESKVVVFNKFGSQLGTIVCHGVKCPVGIAVSEEAKIVIGDLLNHCVQIYDYEGWNLKCIGEGSMSTPLYVNLTSQGDVLVVHFKDGELLVTLISQKGVLKSNSVVVGITRVYGMLFALMPNDDLVVTTKSNEVFFYRQSRQRLDVHPLDPNQQELPLDQHHVVLDQSEQQFVPHPQLLEKQEQQMDLQLLIFDEPEQQLDLQPPSQELQLLDLNSGPLAESLKAPDHFEDIQDLSDHPLFTPPISYAGQNSVPTSGSEEALAKFQKEVFNLSRQRMKLTRQLVYFGRLCAVAVDSQNRIIVVNAVTKQVSVIDFANAIFVFGDSRSGFGELINPLKVASDPQSCSIVVLDHDGVPSMKIFDQNGNYRNSFICSLVVNPIAMTVSNNSKIAVVQLSRFHVVSYNLTGTPMESMKCSNLKSPTGIAVRNDQVFITDYSDHSVKEYNFSGNLVRTFSDWDLTPSPVGIAITRNGYLSVVDAVMDFRMTFFNSSNKLAAGYMSGHRHVNVEGFALTTNYDVLLLCDNGKLLCYSTQRTSQASILSLKLNLAKLSGKK